MSKAKTGKIGMVLFAALLLSGCAWFAGRWETPEVSLVNIRLEQVQVLEATFGIDLRVLNPNDIPLELNGLDCDIEINGRHFARGVAPVAARVEPYGTVIVPLEVYASMLDMAGTLIDAMRRAGQGDAARQQMDYKVAGRMGIKGGRFSLPSFPFESRGRIDLPSLAHP